MVLLFISHNVVLDGVVIHFLLMLLLISRGGVVLFTWVLLLFLHGCYCSCVLTLLFFACWCYYSLHVSATIFFALVICSSTLWPIFLSASHIGATISFLGVRLVFSPSCPR
jgi:hypothetical protein